MVGMDEGGPLSLRPDNVLQLVSGVRIVGLEGASELNGQSGMLFQRDEGRSRYFVRCGRRNVALKSESMVFPPGTRVCVHGLAKAAQYNSKWGQIVSHDEPIGRYLVQLDAATQLQLRRSNVWIVTGCSRIATPYRIVTFRLGNCSDLALV